MSCLLKFLFANFEFFLYSSQKKVLGCKIIQSAKKPFSVIELNVLFYLDFGILKVNPKLLKGAALEAYELKKEKDKLTEAEAAFKAQSFLLPNIRTIAETMRIVVSVLDHVAVNGPMIVVKNSLARHLHLKYSVESVPLDGNNVLFMIL